MRQFRRQSGAALAVSLVLLVVITLLGIAAMRSSALELTMAGNQQLRMEAVERAQSIVDAVHNNGSAFVVSDSSGYTNCTNNVPLNADGTDPCHERSLVLPTSMFTTTVDMAKVIREDPPVIAPPRGLGTSIVAFDAAPFSIEASYDERANGAGRAEVVQGSIVLVPKGGH